MPELFDFNEISKRHPNARLEHAFQVARDHLGIERLLDPEGVFVDLFFVWLTIYEYFDTSTFFF